MHNVLITTHKSAEKNAIKSFTKEEHKVKLFIILFQKISKRTWIYSNRKDTNRPKIKSELLSHCSKEIKFEFLIFSKKYFFLFLFHSHFFLKWFLHFFPFFWRWLFIIYFKKTFIVRVNNTWYCVDEAWDWLDKCWRWFAVFSSLK